MSGIFETIELFNYIGKVKKGETLFIKKRKYISKYSFRSKILRRYHRENLDKQIDIINHHINISKKYIKIDNIIIYIHNMLFEAFGNLKKGVYILYQTYNKPESLEILLRRIKKNGKYFN